MKFTRIELNSDASESTETLTIVRLDRGDFAVQVEQGDHFRGLFDLDGDQISASCEWEIVDDSEIPAEVVESVEYGWASGDQVIERVAA